MTLRPLLLLGLGAALLAAACSADDSEVGRVGDLTVSQSEIAALRTTYDDGVAEGTAFREDLSLVLVQEAVAQALREDFGVVISAAEVDQTAAELSSQFEGAGQSVEEALGIPGATEAMLRRSAYTTLLIDRGIPAVMSDEAFLLEVVEGDPSSLAEVCVRHILVATQEEAALVAERLDGGEDFAEVAAEVSLDPGSPGGDLGCSAASRYVPPFAQAAVVAPIGELFGPVETEFGWHLLIVDDRTAPTLDDLAADPMGSLPQEVTADRWRDWLNGVFATADIEVASTVGVWDSSTGSIAPPGR